MLDKFRLATDFVPMFVFHTVVRLASCNTKPLSELSRKVALMLIRFLWLADHTTCGATSS